MKVKNVLFIIGFIISIILMITSSGCFLLISLFTLFDYEILPNFLAFSLSEGLLLILSVIFYLLADLIVKKSEKNEPDLLITISIKRINNN